MLTRSSARPRPGRGLRNSALGRAAALEGLSPAPSTPIRLYLRLQTPASSGTSTDRIRGGGQCEAPTEARSLALTFMSGHGPHWQPPLGRIEAEHKAPPPPRRHLAVGRSFRARLLLIERSVTALLAAETQREGYGRRERSDHLNNAFDCEKNPMEMRQVFRPLTCWWFMPANQQRGPRGINSGSSVGSH
ncbi:hypothetical protein GN956_G23724 [Arapaima gigas]